MLHGREASRPNILHSAFHILNSETPSIPSPQQLFERYDLRPHLQRAFAREASDPLFTQFRANLTRFSAHKASYVHRAVEDALNSPANDSEFTPQQRAAAQLRVFDNYQRTERTTAIARARTAVQFERFNQPDNLRLFPNLRWLPSRSAEPRTSHMLFYNRVWAKSDPFWAQHCPGTEWGCKCDLEQTDEPPTDNAAVPTPPAPLGLECNPYYTKEIFTDSASYIRKAAKGTERKAQRIAHRCIKTSTPQDESYKCVINGKLEDVFIAKWGMAEAGYAMQGAKNYWLKNEILHAPSSYFKNASMVGEGRVDLSHNTGHTLRLKKKFKRFYYLATQLANEDTVFLNVVQHQNGKFYLYTISQRIPKY